MKLGHIISEPKPVRQGVPHGSILGPVLFLLFVNDMRLNLNNSTIEIYVDDTTLSLSAKWNNITSLTNDLENIEKWSTENKMYSCTSIPRRPKYYLLWKKKLNNVLAITCGIMWALSCMTLPLSSKCTVGDRSFTAVVPKIWNGTVYCGHPSYPSHPSHPFHPKSPQSP